MLKLTPKLASELSKSTDHAVPSKSFLTKTAPLTELSCFKMNVWKLYSLGKSVRILDADGNKMLRESSADSVELRWGFPIRDVELLGLTLTSY